MCRVISCLVLSALLLITSAALAQVTGSSATTSCNFDKTKQVSVEYQRIATGGKKKLLGHEIPFGKVWAPGGKPMALFTNTPVAIGGTNLAIGAYTLFVIPDRETWTLVVSKSTDTSGKYDEQQDLARIPMKLGQLPSSVSEFTAYFAHVAPTQCNLRLDLQKTRSWIVINEK